MKTSFLSTLAMTINRYLQLDPESASRLQKLHGKVLTMELLPFHFIFQLEITEKGIAIHPDKSLPSETTIRGTPLQMVSVMLNKENRQRFFADDLTMEGNAELGQQIIELFDELQIDWEEYLSRLVGDVPAYHAGRFIRGISSWLTNAEKSFTEDINEYIHEEAAWLPAEEALQDFFTEIDNLRMDVDRIEARIKQLKASLMEEEVIK